MSISLNKKDIIWSYIGTILSMGANLLILPFLMYFLDEDLLGLWYIYSSVGAIAVLFDMGFEVTFARNITYCWSGAKKLKKEDVYFVEKSEPDFFMMKKVLKTCKVIYGLISATALLMLLTFGNVYVSYVSRDIRGFNPIISWVVYSVAIFLNLYYGYYGSFLRGVGAVAQANKNNVIARLAQIFLTIVLLYLGMDLLGACIAYLTYGTLFRILSKHSFEKYDGIGEKLKEVKQNVRFADIKEMFALVWHNAWRDGVITICNYLCNQVSTIICSLYLPLSETGMYSLGVQIASAIAQISGTLYNTYQPELQSAYIVGNKEKLKRRMALVVISFIYLFVIGTAICSTLVLPVLRIIKESVVVSVPVLLGLCSYQFILKYRNCFGSYFSCTNRIVYLKAYIFSAIMCVAISFIMMKYFKMGVWGLILAQIISQAVYNFWKWPIMAHKELGMTPITMFKYGNQEIKNMLTLRKQK